MTTHVQQLREQRNTLVSEVKNLMDQSTGHGHTWTNDDDQKYNDHLAEIERIEAALKRHQQVMDLTAEEHRSDETGVPQNQSEHLTCDPLTDQAKTFFNLWAKLGDKAFATEEYQRIRGDMSANPAFQLEKGGYLVPRKMAQSILETLKSYGGMRAVADVFLTDGGEPLTYPTSDGTAEEGEILGENVEASKQDVSFGTKSLGVYKYSSKVVVVPLELMQDAAFDVGSFVQERLKSRLGRITNRHFTTGSGDKEPLGVVTAAPVGNIGAVSKFPAITYEDLIYLEHSIDPIYRTNARWMFHDDMLKLIRLVKDGHGRPLFVPEYNDKTPGGSPGTLLGRAIQINQDVPVPAPDAKSLLLGDFSFYKIRDVMAITMSRFNDSPFATKGQIGFMAMMRSGGSLIDVGGAVKAFKHGAAG